MKRMILPLILLLLLPLTSQSADFRNSLWGDHEAAIRGEEGARFHSESKPVEETKALIFNDQLAGLDAFLIYLLNKGQLAQAKYLFPREHINQNQFLQDFSEVDRVLREEYGQPVESGEFWQNGALKGTMEQGKMIAVGELILMSRWENETTEIVHILHGKNLDVDHEVNYLSKKFNRVGDAVLKKVLPPQVF